MKPSIQRTNIAAIIFSAMIVLGLSCKKNEPIVQTRLDREWKILSDFYAGTSGQNPADSSVLNYVGTAGDRYVFSSNGRVFLQQHGVADTGRYAVGPRNKLTFAFSPDKSSGILFGENSFYDISGLTSHGVTLSYNWITPFGPRREVLKLYR